MTEIEQILAKVTIEGETVKLPAGQLDRKLYQQVAKRLKDIGGKWKGGKTQGFVFANGVPDDLQKVKQGEKINHKQQFQFFATPNELAEEIVQKAEVKAHHKVLEPSAGHGAIINAIHKVQANIKVDYYEPFTENKKVLLRLPNVSYLGDNFMYEVRKNYYDRIIANPPFKNNQDIDHVYKMYDVLKEGGRMVVITSKHWTFTSRKKETEFRNWLDKVNANISEIPANAFKQSGTSISTMLLVIDKKTKFSNNKLFKAILNTVLNRKSARKQQKQNFKQINTTFRITDGDMDFVTRDGDFSWFSDDGFKGVKDKENKTVGKWYDEKEELEVVGTLKGNKLLKWLAENSYMSSDQYYIWEDYYKTNN